MEAKVHPEAQVLSLEDAPRKNNEKEKQQHTKHSLAHIVQRTTRETTVHGIRYIFDFETEFFRRFLWFLVVVACAAFFGQQLFVRITGFMSNPKSVNVEMIYTRSLRFPQVILCNHNAFKITRLYPSLFRSLRTFFATRPDQITPSLVNQLAVYVGRRRNLFGSDPNMTDDYLNSRHSMEDMLIDCTFKGQKCSAANFTIVMSDIGVCYQFVSNEDTIDITSPGPSNGLSLFMNIEQYAYGYGKRHSAGLDVFFKDSDEPAVMMEDGVSVQPGGETSIGLRVSVTEKLHRPYGACDDVSLQYYNQYSRDACWQECLTNFIYQKCSCKSPGMSGNMPLCDVITLYNCSYPLQAKFTLLPESSSCDCPPRCEEATYNPTLNYVPISQFMASIIIQDIRTSPCGWTIVKDIIKARDILRYHNNLTADLNAKDLQVLMDTVGLPLIKYVDFSKPLIHFIAEVNDTLDQLHGNGSFLSSPESQTLLNEIINDMNSLSSNLTTVFPSPFCSHTFQDNEDIFPVEFCLRLFVLGYFGRTQTYEIMGVNGTTALAMADLQQNLIPKCQAIMNKVDQLLAMSADKYTTSGINSMVNNAVNAAEMLQPVFCEVLLGTKSLSLYAEANIPPIGLEVIDDNFVKENLLKVNIFFKQISYTKITKQLSDSVVSLFCDIGGTFGLCLGASIMSIYELIDFVISLALLTQK